VVAGCDGYAAGTTGTVVGHHQGCVVFVPVGPEDVARRAQPRTSLIAPESFVATIGYRQPPDAVVLAEVPVVVHRPVPESARWAVDQSLASRASFADTLRGALQNRRYLDTEGAGRGQPQAAAACGSSTGWTGLRSPKTTNGA
jgi:hypothetical protein